MNTANMLAPDLSMLAGSQDETDKQQLQGNMVCLTFSEGHKMLSNPDQRGNTQSVRKDSTWVNQKDNTCERVEGECNAWSKRSNMCKSLELKNTRPYSGNCGYKKKNIFMLEKGTELCLHLIIFQLTHELSRQPSSSLTSASNGHKCKCQHCTRISSLVMTLNQINCLIAIQGYRHHYSLLKYLQMKAIYSWNVWGFLHKRFFFFESFLWSHFIISLKIKYFQGFAVTELSTKIELPRMWLHALQIKTFSIKLFLGASG